MIFFYDGLKLQIEADAFVYVHCTSYIVIKTNSEASTHTQICPKFHAWLQLRLQFHDYSYF
jgi:hypothetical protein